MSPKNKTENTPSTLVHIKERFFKQLVKNMRRNMVIIMLVALVTFLFVANRYEKEDNGVTDAVATVTVSQQ